MYLKLSGMMMGMVLGSLIVIKMAGHVNSLVQRGCMYTLEGISIGMWICEVVVAGNASAMY